MSDEPQSPIHMYLGGRGTHHPSPITKKFKQDKNLWAIKLMNSIILRSSIRYMVRHPWQFILSIIGIALGVAVVISIDLANESSGTAFTLSTQTVAGKSTHQITGPPGGIPEEIYRKLRVEKKIRPAGPVVEGYISLPDYPGTTLHLLGIDPVADGPFRPYLVNFKEGTLKSLPVLMTEKGTAMISEKKAKELNLKPGDTIYIRAGSIKKKVLIAGIITPSDELAGKALENILLTDISTAQELLDKTGRLSWIDLIIPEGEEGKKIIKEIKDGLPKDIKITETEARSERVKQMTGAFNLNLTAMSMLALLVGMFLIYNTMTFSVIQRRNLIGMLRAIGVTRKEIFTIIIGEALITGIVGTLVGIPAGILLGKGMISLVTQAINDIYFVLQVSEIVIPPFSFIKGISLGIIATLIAAIIPAAEATASPPKTVMSRSVIERRIHRKTYFSALAGIIVIACGFAFMLLSGKNLTLNIAALFIIVFGYSFLTPLYTVIISKISGFILKSLFGITGQMSARSITSSLSRTAVAIAALMVAVSVAVGVGIMVASLRYAVIVWMENFLKADIYVSPPSLVYSRSDLTIDPPLVEKLCAMSEVSKTITFRGVMVSSAKGLFQLVSMDIEPEIYNSLIFKKENPENIWPLLKNTDSVIISETYAYKYNKKPGSIIKLPSDKGEIKFKVLGIFYDYTYEGGVIIVSKKTYEKYWIDKGISSIGFYIKPGIDPEELVKKMYKKAGEQQVILIQSNKSIKETSLSVFDRTFTITAVLKILAMVVAFIGILSALMALQLEREKEMAVLRATGLTRRELWFLIILQTGLMGIFAGLMALLLGIIEAAILIFIINRISFGWTMEMRIEPYILLQGMLLSVTASILAGIYPAVKMSKTSPAQALRNE